MNDQSTHIRLFLCALVLGACEDDPVAIDPAEHLAEIEAWREERVASLKGPDGYLNLAGLHWLEQPASTLGSAPGNEIILPASAAPSVGILRLTGTGVVLDAEPGADLRYEGIPVRSILIADDTTENPVTITHGSLAWTVIRRDDRYALRVRDHEHPAIAAFPPIRYYPVDPALRVAARLERYDEPEMMNVDTVIEGLGWHPESPGKVIFEIDGQQHALEAYASGDELFFVFGDRTSGRETYPAGRFLYARWPEEGAATVLDFNKAYNPPCAYNNFATCPVASPQNRLATRIEAGEMYDPAVHATPETVR